VNADLDRIGGNMFRGLIWLGLWWSIAFVIVIPLSFFLPENLAFIIGITVGLILSFSIFSYWYYRQDVTQQEPA